MAPAYSSFFLISLVFLFPSIMYADVRFTGTAFEISTGKKIYFENHHEKWINGRHNYSDVSYTDINGSKIVHKTIVFSKSRTAPDFTTRDLRTGYLEGAQLLEDGSVRLFTRAKEGEQLREKILKLSETVVIDGGFDYFIRDNWDKLIRGEKLTFYFAVPARLEVFRFRLYQNQELTWANRPARKFTLEFDNLMLRIFLDGFALYYDSESRRLLSFRGLSNISAPSGKNYIAEINFPPLLNMR